MTGREVQFGVAIKNFTPHPDVPNIDEIVTFTTRAEALGFESAWVWDHILLGSKRPFPYLESLVTLTALAMKTQRLQLGTGVFVLPLRNPVVLAKVLTSLDHISKGRLILGVAAGWSAAASWPLRPPSPPGSTRYRRPGGDAGCTGQ